MVRRVFYSFHYKPDSWRVSQIRNIGAIEGNRPATDNDWETITNSGDSAIETWINEQMSGKSCSIVLIGENTANRKWINYEIKKAWDDNRGVVGIYIHNLMDQNGKQSIKGYNPFDYVRLEDNTKLSTIIKAHDPPFKTSTYVYNHIRDNLTNWIEDAIKIRNCY